jgi:hypothetical protein
LALGKTIREMETGQPGMDGKEFGSWRRFYDRHPFGMARSDWWAGLLTKEPMHKVAPSGWARKKRRPATARRGSSPLARVAAITGFPFTPAPQDKV